MGLAPGGREDLVSLASGGGHDLLGFAPRLRDVFVGLPLGQAQDALDAALDIAERRFWLASRRTPSHDRTVPGTGKHPVRTLAGMPSARRGPARLGPGSFAIVCAVLGLIPIGVATLGTPALTWPTVYATASGCHPVEVRTGRRGGHDVTACRMRWTGDDGRTHSGTVDYPLGEVRDGAVRTVRVMGNRAADPGGVWDNLRFAAVLGGVFLLLAAYLARRWWVRRTA